MRATYNSKAQRDITLRMQQEVRTNFQSVINENLPFLNSKETPISSKNDLIAAYMPKGRKIPKHELSMFGKSTNLTTNDSIF